MHHLSAKKIFTTSILPIVLPILFAGVALGISFPFSVKSLQAKRKLLTLQAITINRMLSIHKSLENKMLQTGRVPQTLEELVSEKALQPDVIQSPANPKGRGFFYNGGKPIADLYSREILLCDYAENFGEEGRTILYRGGYAEFLPPASFQARLRQAENLEFAKALESAEKRK
jgi:hypothetical protein